MPTRNVNLTDYYDAFVQEQIASGRYKNASEVMRAGLRLLETHTSVEDQKLQLLQTMAAEGFEALDQGEGIVLNSESQLRKRIASIGKRAAKKSARSSR